MYDLYIKIFQYLGLPKVLALVSWPVFPFVGIAALLTIMVIFLVLMERKVLAFLTVRKGPNRVGPWGLLQTIADAIKLLFKEDIMPKKSDKLIFTLAPVIFFTPVMIIYSLVPFAKGLAAVNVAAGVLLLIAISSVSIIGIVLSGWASNNKYSLLGGMRAAAQAISYEIPLVIAMLAVVLLSGSMNFSEIISSQAAQIGDKGIWSWNIFSWNLWPGFLGFVIFFICSIAEINRVPFDLPEAESELVSGYNTEYSGMKFALFFLAEYAALFIISVLTSILFFGGYLSPFNDYLSFMFLPNLINNDLLVNIAVHIEQVFWLISKTYFVIFLIMLIRATLPRLRVDQLMGFSWKYLLPLSFFNLLFVAVYSYFKTGLNG